MKYPTRLMYFSPAALALWQRLVKTRQASRMFCLAALYVWGTAKEQAEAWAEIETIKKGN